MDHFLGKTKSPTSSNTYYGITACRARMSVYRIVLRATAICCLQRLHLQRCKKGLPSSIHVLKDAISACFITTNSGLLHDGQFTDGSFIKLITPSMKIKLF